MPDRIRRRFRGFLGFLAAHPDLALNLSLVGGRDEAFTGLRGRHLRTLAGLLGLDVDEFAATAPRPMDERGAALEDLLDVADAV